MSSSGKLRDESQLGLHVGRRSSHIVDQCGHLLRVIPEAGQGFVTGPDFEERRYRRASCPAMSPAWLRATARKACWSSTTPASPATLTTRPRRAQPCMRRKPALRRSWPGPCRIPSLTCCARRPARPSGASRPAASTCASGWTGPGSAAPLSCTPARSPRAPSCGGGCNCKGDGGHRGGCCPLGGRRAQMWAVPRPQRAGGGGPGHHQGAPPGPGHTAHCTGRAAGQQAGRSPASRLPNGSPAIASSSPTRG